MQMCVFGSVFGPKHCNWTACVHSSVFAFVRVHLPVHYKRLPYLYVLPLPYSLVRHQVRSLLHLCLRTPASHLPSSFQCMRALTGSKKSSATSKIKTKSEVLVKLQNSVYTLFMVLGEVGKSKMEESVKWVFFVCLAVPYWEWSLIITLPFNLWFLNENHIHCILLAVVFHPTT